MNAFCNTWYAGSGLLRSSDCAVSCLPRAQPPETTVDLTTPRSGKKPVTPQGTRSRSPGAAAMRKSNGATDGRSEHVPSNAEVETKRSEAIEREVDKARRRLREIKSYHSVRGLQQKFNSLKDEAEQNPPRSYDSGYVRELDNQAHEAFRWAAALPRGQADEAWGKAAELFYKGLEAMGHKRSEIDARIVAEEEAVREANKNTNSEKSRRVRVKWKKYRTMIFTMLAIDKQNAAKVKEVTAELVRKYLLCSTIAPIHDLERSASPAFGLNLPLKRADMKQSSPPSRGTWSIRFNWKTVI